MPHAPLLSVMRDQPELYHAVLAAQSAADHCGTKTPDSFKITDAWVRFEVNKIPDKGLVAERPDQLANICTESLIPLIIDAVGLEYDIRDTNVFRALFELAKVLHFSSYVPMRVMGSTIEGIIKPENRERRGAPKK
jgi:hypothetical protein